tara:strand:- start:400 stop:1335 length:936 start_codon:yes stop_codon:yes gene_type:complete
MNQNTLKNDNTKYLNDDGIDIVLVFNRIWNQKKLVVSLFIISCILSVIFALSLPNIYKSRVILAPVTNLSESSLMQNSALSSLASITGRKITNQANSTNEAVQILRSYSFFSEILNEYEMKVPLLASTEWDLAKQELVIDPRVYDVDNEKWIVAAPTDQEAYEFWVEIFSVSQDIDTGFLAMEIKHFSPKLTKEWLDKIVYSINEKARAKAIFEAENSIEYLKPQFQSADLSEVRVILASLIQEQIQQIMLAKSKPEYLFKVIDPPYSPESKSEPKRSVICIIGAFIGMFLSMLIGFMRETYLSYKNISNA